MDRLIERCAGLDVHKASVTATVRVAGEQGARQTQTRTFRTTTAGLVLLGDWLASFGVTVVGMESTGVYWKPVYYLLEDEFECWLLNAQHLKNVPGRKTDVADSVWICQLVEHGLVRPSFVPPRPIRELRDLTRYRKALIQERTREAQRLHKVLEDAGVKLACVASDPLGSRGGRCWRRWSAAPTTRRCWPTWPAAGCGPSCRRCARRSRAASAPTTGCWCRRCWPGSTSWTRRSTG
jgi:transposase